MPALPVEPNFQRVSASIEAKYRSAIQALKAGGATLVEEEWPPAKAKGSGRNAIEDLYYFQKANGKPVDPMLPARFHSYTGQIAEFVRDYLNASVSIKDILDDMTPMGEGHSSSSFAILSGTTDETQFRYVMAEHPMKAVTAYNSYFDELDVDVIMVPGQFCDAIQYEQAAISVNTLRKGDSASGSIETSTASVIQCNLISYNFIKEIPVPKMMVPTGLDSQGRPTGVMFLGRAGPRDATKDERGLWMYEDSSTVESDVEFLYTVKTLVDHMYAADPTLKRAEPKLVKGPGNLFHSRE